ncbi:MAG: hypothetical protein ACXAEX_16085 [Promethearchaeota archaeon]
MESVIIRVNEGHPLPGLGLARARVAAFEEEFGTVNCMDLLGVDRRTEEGKTIYDEMKARGETHCGEYVDWASSHMLKIL